MRFYYLVFVSICMSISLKLFSADIEYTNPVSNSRERIEFETHEFWREKTLNHWEKIGKIDFRSIDFSAFPSPFAYRVFPKGTHYWITIAGTGQLYDFDPIQLTFHRLDQTFFRGYNFGSLQFLRKDTLFSYGGLGFWHYNNIETYFSPQSKEWERVHIPLIGPKRILTTFSGYSKRQDKLYVLELPDYFVQKPIEVDQLELFSYNFHSKIWNSIGWVSDKDLQHGGMHTLEAIWVQDLFILPKSSPLLIIDPVNNKLYEYQGPRPNFFNPGYIVSEKGSMIYSYQIETPINSHSTNLDSMDVRKLLADSREIGPFYSSIPPIPFVFYGYALGLLLLILSLMGNFWFWRNAKKQSKSANYYQGLTPEAEIFLKLCLEKGPKFQFSSEEITDMMGLSQRSFDSQRQYRSKMINQINLYFKVHHAIPEALVRVTSFEDKRFNMYSISPSDFERIQQILLM